MSQQPVRASFHDPDGSVYLGPGTVQRRLTPDAALRLDQFLATATARAFLAQGQLPATQRLPATAGAPVVEAGSHDNSAVWFEHSRLPFINYPHEWLPEQLRDAGLLTLDLARAARAEGWDLKDGNARNVVFRGMQPVFVDLGSFVPRDDSQPVWRPAGQLHRHVLLPLLLLRHRGLAPAATLLAHADGVPHTQAWAALRGLPVLDGDVLWLCALPAWLSSRAGSGAPATAPRRFEPEVARAAADRTVRSLTRRLSRIRLGPRASSSHWAGYEDSRSHYPALTLEGKRATVADMLKSVGTGTLLDIGTNGGEYANLAASLGHQVVAIDSDAGALSRARSQSQAAGLDVLHLLVDFAAPTPALGWSGAECLSFDSRCAGAFDTVMALAVMHHVLASGGIPLDELVAKLAHASRRSLVIEFVAPQDPMFSTLTAQRGLDFGWLDRSRFEAALARHFVVDERAEVVPGHRALYRCTRLGT